MSSMSVSSALYDVFGGWHNFTQGAGGAFLGVVGAYVIAVSTFRREARHDRQRLREVAAVDAAGQLTRAIAELPERLRRIQRLESTSGTGIDYSHVTRWNKLRNEIAEQVTEHGTLLPAPLEAKCIELVGQSDHVFVVDADDEHRMLILVDTASTEALERTTQAVDDTLSALQEFRRNPTVQPGHSQRQR